MAYRGDPDLHDGTVERVEIADNRARVLVKGGNQSLLESSPASRRYSHATGGMMIYVWPRRDES